MDVLGLYAAEGNLSISIVHLHKYGSVLAILFLFVALQNALVHILVLFNYCNI